MFILHTTAAILISFLAIIAYRESRNLIAKGTSRLRDLGRLVRQTEFVKRSVKSPTNNNVTQLHAVGEINVHMDGQMERYKQIYFKLHNLEHHAKILPECRQLLLSLLTTTLSDAFKEPDNGILAVQEFSRDSLNSFLKVKDVNVTNRWEEYLIRRKAGGSREMFADKDEAKWWLKQAAMVKYVDGAWLGHINKISTPFMYRKITKNAWQVMSEELGDGDLAKNHIYVYRKLMDDIGAGLPAADSKDFIHPRHGMNETRCWKAAVAQLLISLFSHEFLPEALGFNMAYESLPLHLLKTVKELRELRLDPYYFELHISIDNADSGHAAMAMAAVVDYIELIAKSEGERAAHAAWKRVQAGYILAEGLPTTPESPSLKRTAEELVSYTKTEAALLSIFAAKSFVAHKIHCNSRLKIGRRSLVDWLEPNAFMDTQWQKDFLRDLSNCKPWVIKGNSDKSRLVKELSWEGKMFGSFTQTEVEVVKKWIDDLDNPTQIPSQDPKVYLNFTERPFTCPEIELKEQDIFLHYPVLANIPPMPVSTRLPSDLKDSNSNDALSLDIDIKKLSLTQFLPLWFTSSTLLESVPSVPVRAADTFGSAIVRVLRAQNGFDSEGLGVAGMDEVRRTDNGQAIGIVELGLDICRRAGLNEPKNLKDAVTLGTGESVVFAEWMMWMGMRWLTYRDVLIGLTWAFMEVHEALANLEGHNTLLSSEGRQILKDIALRERTGLSVCRRDLEKDRKRMADFREGFVTASRAIEACLSTENVHSVIES
ncbi:hypothetical protein P153DRAFT_350282 [Dothidotthia symphoricarpi CBS 119687]|uniref:Heme oxygenase-like protein n=1 Tax=Dothidotthia symphoricarpi CBS 119687 TaxID=1392245 RepID=A0A6A5ZXM6_9PLEO|nr:uncharacterized protein P153DRAFT_350282 [Dothidotthia symphoricarpi CBS 119687]KAF2124340.1 hypothetical protein P153DRAFT_350282 [Dothidotthia symphoricarpi CBS 119687]